jgi:hypothetical protein
MNDDRIDDLLKAHFAQPARHQPLPQLQRAVWQGIAARERASWAARLFEGVFPKELRFGPAFAAMVVGITLGYATLDVPVTSNEYAAAEGLGFNLFSSMSSHPLQKVKL